MTRWVARWSRGSQQLHCGWWSQTAPHATTCALSGRWALAALAGFPLAEIWEKLDRAQRTAYTFRWPALPLVRDASWRKPLLLHIVESHAVKTVWYFMVGLWSIILRMPNYPSPFQLAHTAAKPLFQPACCNSAPALSREAEGHWNDPAKKWSWQYNLPLAYTAKLKHTSFLVAVSFMILLGVLAKAVEHDPTQEDFILVHTLMLRRRKR